MPASYGHAVLHSRTMLCRYVLIEERPETGLTMGHSKMRTRCEFVFTTSVVSEYLTYWEAR